MITNSPYYTENFKDEPDDIVKVEWVPDTDSIKIHSYSIDHNIDINVDLPPEYAEMLMKKIVHRMFERSEKIEK